MNDKKIVPFGVELMKRVDLADVEMSVKDNSKCTTGAPPNTSTETDD